MLFDGKFHTQLQLQSEISNSVIGAIFWYKSCKKIQTPPLYIIPNIIIPIIIIIPNKPNSAFLSAIMRKGLRKPLAKIYMSDSLHTS